ncbi:hypothetical protein GGS23DRAFT_594200 [Durotheca rogersii]|uniref:uncharacterized protein n=1 Tax=Durotheca rogersii TaxID=419775 RepID=UPI002220B45F|nr:uncharacterized protein GGS23DRAFT_594200 [Durotheca rogersii]KAI5866046.1 hypothetical protein GGS23DRAFT_594200 [Durotheca rogersii]
MEEEHDYIKEEEEEDGPEQCPKFVLEHRHERLEYLDSPDAYPESYPATWDTKVGELDTHWLSRRFAHIGRYQAAFEEKLFAACELLHTLTEDADIRAANVSDLDRCCPPSDPRSVGAQADLLRLEARLHEQQVLVFNLIHWAQDWCPIQAGIEVKL